MIGFNLVAKHLIIAAVLGFGIYQVLHKRGVDKKDVMWIIVAAFVISIILDQGWPQEWSQSQGSPKAISNYSATDNRQLFADFAVRTKFLLNSYVDNHLDKHIWQELLYENQKELGGGDNNLTRQLLNHVVLHRENWDAMLSHNPNRIKETMGAVYEHGAMLADLLKISPEMMKQHDQYIISMFEARMEQNWLRDAKLFVEFNHHMKTMSSG